MSLLAPKALDDAAGRPGFSGANQNDHERPYHKMGSNPPPDSQIRHLRFALSGFVPAGSLTAFLSSAQAPPPISLTSKHSAYR